MMRIKGSFAAHYQASPEAFTKVSPYVHTYLLQLHPGSTITDVEETGAYTVPAGYQKGTLFFDKVDQVKVFFISQSGKKPLLDDLNNVVITNAVINEVGRRGNLVYGTITGLIQAQIGQPEKIAPLSEEVLLPVAEKEVKQPLSPTVSPANLDITNPSIVSPDGITLKSTLPKRIATFLGLLLGLCAIVELLSNSHLSCHAPKADKPDPIYEDSITTTFNDSIIVNSNGISLSVYDWDKIDGDAVGIIFNGDTLTHDITLKKEPNTWYLNSLKSGANDLQVYATNQGKSGSSTPTFEVNDGKNVQVFRLNCQIGNPLHVLIYTKPQQ